MIRDPAQQSADSLPIEATRDLSLWPAGIAEPAEGELESRVWAKVQARIDHPSQTTRPVVPTRSNQSGRRYLMLGGAIAMAATAVAVVVTHPFKASTHWEPAQREYSTQTRQQVALDLPDGSHVVLAPESHVSYTQDSRGTRHVSLVGQAVFTVVHDPARTFTVQTGSVRTQVLGTTFQVQRYPDDVGTTVLVQSGKVASSGRRSSVVLMPGTVGYVTDSVAIATESHDANTGFAWVNGKLVFQEMPVGSVLRTLGRWYGYTFQLADSSLAAQRVTTTLLVNEPTEGLQMLKQLLRVTMTFRGDTVVLHPSARTSTPTERRIHPPRQGSALYTEIGK